MSVQKSMLKFKGKMDGISFYQREGVFVARKANGPSREKILKDPRFARTRENMSEFTGLAMASGSFLLAFAPVKNLRDNKLRGRGASAFRRMMVSDQDSILGQRQILLSQHRSELKRMELNLNAPLSTLLTAKVAATHSDDRKTATASIANLQNYMVLPPPQSTHFQLVQHVAVLADVQYDTEGQRYERADHDLDTLSKTTYSEHLSLQAEPGSLTLDTTLDVDVLNDNVTVVQAVGILFFKKHGTAYYPSFESNGMRIVDVY